MYVWRNTAESSRNVYTSSATAAWHYFTRRQPYTLVRIAVYSFEDEAQTALFKDPVRTAQ
jgi:hypothetical protein